jgi:hypothetical protein
MKSFLKITGWLVVGLVGLVLYLTFPEVQKYVAGALGGAVVYRGLKTLLEDVLTRLVKVHLLELGQQNNATADRLDTIERKVSAILQDAYERRRAGF